ncbi:MAG: hypothetical protein ABI811_14540 [Acidobacteriota bacterium]
MTPAILQRIALVTILTTASAQQFPPLDQANPPLSRTLSTLRFCMTARKNIPRNSAMPLFTFEFAEPGATGKVLIDDKEVQTFKAERHLKIKADVAAGNHRFDFILDRPALNTLMSSHDDFKYCQG